MTLELIITILALVTAIITTYEPGKEALDRWRAPQPRATAQADAGVETP